MMDFLKWLRLNWRYSVLFKLPLPWWVKNLFDPNPYGDQSEEINDRGRSVMFAHCAPPGDIRDLARALYVATLPIALSADKHFEGVTEDQWGDWYDAMWNLAGADGHVTMDMMDLLPTAALSIGKRGKGHEGYW